MHIAVHPESAPCNNHTFTLILNWLNWFLSYAKHICESQSFILHATLPKPIGKKRLTEFMALIRMVVNSGNWLHNRTEFTCC